MLDSFSKEVPIKTNQLPPPQQCFVALIGGGGVSPICKKLGILFGIKKVVGRNVLLTRGWVGSFLSVIPIGREKLEELV